MWITSLKYGQRYFVSLACVASGVPPYIWQDSQWCSDASGSSFLPFSLVMWKEVMKPALKGHWCVELIQAKSLGNRFQESYLWAGTYLRDLLHLKKIPYGGRGSKTKPSVLLQGDSVTTKSPAVLPGCLPIFLNGAGDPLCLFSLPSFGHWRRTAPRESGTSIWVAQNSWLREVSGKVFQLGSDSKQQSWRMRTCLSWRENMTLKSQRASGSSPYAAQI